MRKILLVMAVLALTSLIVAGCESKSQQTGYATYSANNQPQGAGGCGRFAGQQAAVPDNTETIQSALPSV
ncbi:hypothetical protein HYU11_04155 [Candidatus Woesearchaeota archaeon]|nr:hypothetical protein [Candidatus Woesearchaeota archaeon]